MPLGDPFGYYGEEPVEEPPPTLPPAPPSGDGIGPLPVIPDPGSGPATPPPPVVPTGGGGGGGGGFGALPPGYPNFNIPAPPGYTPGTFAAPTMEQVRNTPGFQFRLKSGSDALERSAAARGVLRTGGTLQDIVEQGQNFATGAYQTEFQNAAAIYDRMEAGRRAAYAPLFARWSLGASGSRDAQLARYSTQLGAWQQGQQPRYEPPVDEGPPPTPPDVSNYSGGDPWTDNRLSGDPWTDGVPFY